MFVRSSCRRLLIKFSNDGFGHVSTKQCKEVIEAEVGRVLFM